jgi:hypothetical protein
MLVLLHTSLANGVVIWSTGEVKKEMQRPKLDKNAVRSTEDGWLIFNCKQGVSKFCIKHIENLRTKA